MFYAFAGIVMIYSWVGCYLQKHDVNLWMERVGYLSFGVYLFQQFILKGLYDHTQLPFLLGCYWLPWISFIIALFGSLVLPWLLRKTEIGRKLIG